MVKWFSQPVNIQFQQLAKWLTGYTPGQFNSSDRCDVLGRLVVKSSVSNCLESGSGALSQWISSDSVNIHDLGEISSDSVNIQWLSESQWVSQAVIDWVSIEARKGWNTSSYTITTFQSKASWVKLVLTSICLYLYLYLYACICVGIRQVKILHFPDIWIISMPHNTKMQGIRRNI